MAFAGVLLFQVIESGIDESDERLKRNIVSALSMALFPALSGMEDVQYLVLQG